MTGDGEPVWLTPHLRDFQPEGERFFAMSNKQMYM